MIDSTVKTNLPSDLCSDALACGHHDQTSRATLPPVPARSLFPLPLVSVIPAGPQPWDQQSLRSAEHGNKINPGFQSC